MGKIVNLLPGDPAPHFVQASYANPRYAFSSAAGRYLVLCFLGSGEDAHARAAVAAAQGRPDLFDDEHASFFGVSIDPRDRDRRRLADRYPGFRFLWDFDLSVSRLYGAVEDDVQPTPGGVRVRRFWLVLDPTMRVLHAEPFRENRGDIDALIDVVAKLPPPARFAGVELQAPVLPHPYSDELNLQP